MYSLIVIGYSNESWLSDKVVQIAESRFLEYTEQNLALEFRGNIAKVYSLPCLIMSEGYNSNIHLCRISEVQAKSRDLIVSFEIIEENFLTVSDILDHLSYFGINEWEINRTHWAIKENDLEEVLSKIDINIESKNSYLIQSFIQNFPKAIESYNLIKSLQTDDSISLNSETKDSEYIEGTTDFIAKITNRITDGNYLTFYRGHSNLRYKLEPSLFRKTKKGDYQYLENENTIYNELLTQNFAEFSTDNSTFDRLVRMQHFSLPTRLLDISTNPLIALYFACKGNVDKDGDVILIEVAENKVKYFDSDTATCIANLCKLSFKDKEILSIGNLDSNYKSSMKKLYHCIKDDKPYFKERIVPRSINEILCIKGKITNLRINAQSGAFLLFGLDAILEDNNEFGFNIKHYLIKAEDKEKILAELDALNINDSSLFPYLENSARYIANKFQKK